MAILKSIFSILFSSDDGTILSQRGKDLLKDDKKMEEIYKKIRSTDREETDSGLLI